MKHIRPTYIAHTQPGFEIIAAQEISAQLEGAEVRDTFAVADKNGLVVFTYDGDPNDTLALRLSEDVFVQVTAIRDMPPTYGGLRQLRETVQKLSFDAAIGLVRQVDSKRGGQGKLRYRVIARQVGRASYLRSEAQEAVEKGITARGDRRWQLTEERGLELWLTILPERTLLALRLSDEKMRHRDEKREHLPASLRPSAAAALVWLTRPKANDVFLDPMCGAGTILIERALAGRYQMLIGGDIREEAVAVALANIGPRYKPIELHEWDARNLALDAGSVSAVAVNLPFGRQLGTVDDNRRLYPAFLREMARVLRPRARLVLLTGDTRTLGTALQRTPEFIYREAFPVQVLGASARIEVVERT